MPRPSGVQSRMVQSGVGSGARCGSKPGSAVSAPPSAAQNRRTSSPSRRQTVGAAPSPSSVTRMDVAAEIVADRLIEFEVPPAALAGEGELARDRRAADDGDREALLDVGRRDVERADERGAHRAGPLALGPEHPEIGEERVVPAEQVDEADIVALLVEEAIILRDAARAAAPGAARRRAGSGGGARSPRRARRSAPGDIRRFRLPSGSCCASAISRAGFSCPGAAVSRCRSSSSLLRRPFVRIANRDLTLMHLSVIKSNYGVRKTN